MKDYLITFESKFGRFVTQYSGANANRALEAFVEAYGDDTTPVEIVRVDNLQPDGNRKWRKIELASPKFTIKGQD